MSGKNFACANSHPEVNFDILVLQLEQAKCMFCFKQIKSNFSAPFLDFIEAQILNFSLLLCLAPSKKGFGWWWGGTGFWSIIEKI